MKRIFSNQGSSKPLESLTLRGVPLLLVMVLLTSCAAQTGDFPTIAKRPIEKLPTGDQPDPARIAERNAVQSISLDTEQQKIVANQLELSRQSDMAFAKALPIARIGMTAAGSAPKGGETWAKAQSTLSQLIVLRNRTAATLIVVDAMIINAQRDAMADDQMVDLSPMFAAQKEISAMVNEQDSQLALLNRRLEDN